MDENVTVLRLPEDQPFDLGMTLSCGQAFGWRQAGPWWCGMIGDEQVRLRQRADELLCSGTAAPTLARFLGLSLDLREVHASIDRDPFIHGAVLRYGGTRILSQDPWECLISFICATNANIPVITRRIGLLRERYGDPLPGGGHSFPDCDSLSRSCEQEIRSCCTGYRAPYIRETAAMVADDPSWADRIRAANYPDAHRMLLSFPGVGAKAADCVLLFGFEKWEAFPIDVWVRRAMERYPGAPPDAKKLSPASYRKTGDYARDYFGKYAGYAQQYLFMAVREEAGRTVQVPVSQLVM